MVWQTQKPLITSHLDELARWPQWPERVQPYGVQSYSWLPLTTAGQRLGTHVCTSKQSSAYDTTDLSFLQYVANQVAVAVEKLGDVIVALTHTGLRIGELAALRWRDLDDDLTKVALVDESRRATRQHRAVARTTKTRRGRVLPVHPSLREILGG